MRVLKSANFSHFLIDFLFNIFCQLDHFSDRSFIFLIFLSVFISLLLLHIQFPLLVFQHFTEFLGFLQFPFELMFKLFCFFLGGLTFFFLLEYVPLVFLDNSVFFVLFLLELHQIVLLHFIILYYFFLF
jgi:hypothetical protein